MSGLRAPGLVVLFLFGAIISGCGGGGGQPPPPSVQFVLQPSSLVGNQYEREPQLFRVTATVTGTSGDISGTIYVQIVDQAGIIQPDVQFGQTSDTTFVASLNTSATLGVGPHKGAMQILVCGDQACTKKYGSASLGYDITVLSNTNLTPLVTLNGAGDWANFEGNSAHTGYVPVTLDSTKFSARWLKGIVNFSGENQTMPATTAGELIFLPSNGLMPTTPRDALYAFNESDGSLAWTFEGPEDTIYVGPAVSANGALYLETTQSGRSDSLWALNVVNGSTVFQTQIPGYFSGGYKNRPVYPPVVSGNVVLAEAGKTEDVCCSGGTFTQLGVGAYDASTGVQKWFSDRVVGTSSTDGQSDYFYPGSFSGHGLHHLGLNDGVEHSDVTDPNYGVNGGGFLGVPVVVGANPDVVVNAGDHVIAFNAATSTIKWSALQGSGFSVNGNTPVANGQVFVQQPYPPRLMVLNEASGQQVWSWTAPGPAATAFPAGPNAVEQQTIGSPIVTDNIVFFSTNLRVYAIDRNTHQTVWVYPHPGQLALSKNGVLYISRVIVSVNTIQSDGYFAAINLH